MKTVLKISLLTASLIVSNVFTNKAFAEEAYNIPVIEQAQVFAQFTHDLPAVVNYFSNESEETIINFYQDVYGEPLSQNRIRERLTLFFTDKNNNVRVIISQQNNKRQVDVLLNSNK